MNDMVIRWGRQERPAGASTLEQVRALTQRAEGAAATAAADAIAEAQPGIEQAGRDAAAAALAVAQPVLDGKVEAADQARRDAQSAAVSVAGASPIITGAASEAQAARDVAAGHAAAVPALAAQVADLKVQVSTLSSFGTAIPVESLRFLAKKFGYGGDGRDISLMPVSAPAFTDAEGIQFFNDFSSLPGGQRNQIARAFRTDLYRKRFANACTPHWFEERLVGFWKDHFTTTFALHEVGLHAGMIENAIRQNVGRTFVDMLRAAELHPSMLIYLNQNVSSGNNSPYTLARPQDRGLNENLGRELLELHTIGVTGSYTQDDVREAANVLTGCRVVNGSLVYDPTWAEPGVHTVLGVEYPENTLAEVHRLLNDLALNPQTAAHLAWKLAVHFVSDTPPQSLIDRMAAAYIEKGGHLPSVYTVMLTAPETLAAGLTKARQPQDWMPACFRAVGMTPAEVRTFAGSNTMFEDLVLTPLANMGQTILGPIGPDGWPEAADAWIQPQLLPVRIEWARNTLPVIFARTGRPLPTLDEVLFRAFGDDVPPQVAEWAPLGQDIEMSIAAVLTSAEFMSR